MIRLFIGLITVVGIVLVAIILIATFLYLITGVNSVMLYQPPVAPLLSFIFNVVEVAGVAAGAIFGLGVFLHQIPKLRERLDDYVGDQKKKTVGAAS